MDQPEVSPASRGSLFAVFLAVFIDLLGFGMVIPLVGIYAENLISEDQRSLMVGLLMVSFSGMQFLCSPIWGRISDRIGRRPVILVGLAGSTICYAVFGYATASGSLVWMFISRLGAGISGATISTAQAYIADVTTREKRAKGMALIGAAFGLGFTFGPLLAYAALIPGETELSSWPGYVASLLSGCAFLFAYFKLPESLKPGSEAAEHRLIDLRAFFTALRFPTVGVLLIIWFVAVLSFANFESVLPFLFKADPETGGFGYSLQKVLLLFALVGFIHALAQGGVRSMSARMSETKLATGGAVTSVLGFLAMIGGIELHSLPLIILGLSIIAAGFAFIPAPLQSLISRRCDPKHQGEILGVGQSLGSLARILGHGLCYALFKIDATIPFWYGVALMGLALLLITTNASRGKDYVPATTEAAPVTQ